MKKGIAVAALMLTTTGIASARCIGACGMMDSTYSHQRYVQDVANHALLSKYSYKLQRKAADRKHDAAKEIAENMREIDKRYGLVRKYSRKLMNVEQQQFNRGASFDMYEPPIAAPEYQQPTTSARYYTENNWQEVK